MQKNLIKDKQSSLFDPNISDGKKQLNNIDILAMFGNFFLLHKKLNKDKQSSLFDPRHQRRHKKFDNIDTCSFSEVFFSER
jgi:hypothetical protein